MWSLKIELSEQSNSNLEESTGKHAIRGLSIHLAGYAPGFLGIGLVQVSVTTFPFKLSSFTSQQVC
jgi:hypothetical protein